MSVTTYDRKTGINVSGKISEWIGADLSAITYNGQNGGHILFPPTFSAADSSKTLTTISNYWFIMPFIVHDNMIGELDQFRVKYTDQLTSTHTGVAVWDGMTGELIENAQEVHSSAAPGNGICHVDLSNRITAKTVFVGTCAGIPGTPASEAVTYQGGFAAQCIGLGLHFSQSNGENTSAVLVAKGTGDWEVPPNQLDFTSNNQAIEGSLFMAGTIPTPLFCCLAQKA